MISHARTEPARFLGYDILVQSADTKRDATGRRSLNGKVGLRVPAELITAKCRPYLRHGKAIHRPERLNESAFSIVARYQTEYRGLVNYYRLANNLWKLGRLKWVMEQSLTMTLAGKYRTGVRKVYKRFGTTLHTSEGSFKGLKV